MKLIYVISNELTFDLNLLIHELHIGEMSNSCQRAFVLRNIREESVLNLGLLFRRPCRLNAKCWCSLLKRRVLFLLALIVSSFLLFLAVSA